MAKPIFANFLLHIGGKFRALVDGGDINSLLAAAEMIVNESSVVAISKTNKIICKSDPNRLSMDSQSDYSIKAIEEEDDLVGISPDLIDKISSFINNFNNKLHVRIFVIYLMNKGPMFYIRNKLILSDQNLKDDIDRVYYEITDKYDQALEELITSFPELSTSISTLMTNEVEIIDNKVNRILNDLNLDSNSRSARFDRIHEAVIKFRNKMKLVNRIGLDHLFEQIGTIKNGVKSTMSSKTYANSKSKVIEEFNAYINNGI